MFPSYVQGRGSPVESARCSLSRRIVPGGFGSDLAGRRLVSAGAFVALAILALIPATSRAASSSGPTDSGGVGFHFPYRIAVRDLDNGLRLVMVPMPTPGVVTYETIVRAGARNELEPGRTGYAHFFEHMMFHGTDRFPARKYDSALAMLGAEGNGSTSEDMTVYYNTLPASGLVAEIEMESDRFQNTRYTEEEFRKEAGAVLGEMAVDQSSPESMMEDTLLAAAFHVHPYGHTVIGYERDVRAMPAGYDYSRTFFGRFYRPEYCAVLVTGDFDTLTTESALRAAYSGWKRGGYTAEIPPEPPPGPPARHDLRWKTPARPTLWIAFRTPGFQETKIASALELIREIYFGETSALRRELVEERGLLESIRGEFEPSRDPRLFVVSAGLKSPADYDSVRARILREVREAASRPVPWNRLSAAKRHIFADQMLTLETTGGAGWRLSNFIRLTGDPRSIESYYGIMADLTPRDLEDAAGRSLDPEHCLTITMTGEARP